MKQVALSEIKDDLSKYLHQAESEEIVITRHGKPAGILMGFASEDDWFEYKLEHDPRFLKRIERARQSLHSGKGVRLEDVLQKSRRQIQEKTEGIPHDQLGAEMEADAPPAGKKRRRRKP